MGDCRRCPPRYVRFLRTRLLTPRQKLRVALERFVTKRAPDHEETVAEFFGRRLGRASHDDVDRRRGLRHLCRESKPPRHHQRISRAEGDGGGAWQRLQGDEEPEPSCGKMTRARSQQSSPSRMAWNASCRRWGRSLGDHIQDPLRKSGASSPCRKVAFALHVRNAEGAVIDW